MTTCRGFIRCIRGGLSPPGNGGGGGGGGSGALTEPPLFLLGASGISTVRCTSSTVFHFLSLAVVVVRTVQIILSDCESVQKVMREAWKKKNYQLSASFASKVNEKSFQLLISH